ncbi:MAG: indole-3-glycerol phosphate synthase TrpC [Acidimicrobiales bacterium]
MSRYLDEIVAWHRDRVAADERDPGVLKATAHEAARCDPQRDFAAALVASPAVAIIAEIKRQSPSKGALDLGLDPPLMAREYQDGGAACLSVLTDQPHFGGSRADLIAARTAVGIPVLRKDFTVSATDVYDARIMGADAVLLIAAVLSDEEIAALLAETAMLAMTALVEVHDEEEARRVVDAGASVIGVNQRDLQTFKVDRDRAARVAAALPRGVVRVAESGISAASQISDLAEAGFDAVLIGAALVRAADRTTALRSLASPVQTGAR